MKAADHGVSTMARSSASRVATSTFRGSMAPAAVSRDASDRATHPRLVMSRGGSDSDSDRQKVATRSHVGVGSRVAATTLPRDDPRETCRRCARSSGRRTAGAAGVLPRSRTGSARRLRSAARWPAGGPPPAAAAGGRAAQAQSSAAPMRPGREGVMRSFCAKTREVVARRIPVTGPAGSTAPCSPRPQCRQALQPVHARRQDDCCLQHEARQRQPQHAGPQRPPTMAPTPAPTGRAPAFTVRNTEPTRPSIAPGVIAWRSVW